MNFYLKSFNLCHTCNLCVLLTVSLSAYISIFNGVISTSVSNSITLFHIAMCFHVVLLWINCFEMLRSHNVQYFVENTINQTLHTQTHKNVKCRTKFGFLVLLKPGV